MTCAKTRVVLVGGGHAHVEVLRRWRAHASPHASLTLIVDRPDAVYSGMIPGVIAGQYELAQATIPLRPLAAAAGAEVVVAPVLRVDPQAQTLEVQAHEPLHYDLASLDVGSVPHGLARPEVPGVADYGLATRPIGNLVKRLDACLVRRQQRASGRALFVVVVGGGTAGVELAFALLTRLGRAGQAANVCVVGHAEQPLSDGSASAIAKTRAAMKRRGITYQGGCKVVEVRADAVITESGGTERPLPADLVLWATGAAPPPVILHSDLPHDPRGFVLTGPTLQVKGHPNLFAAGDCAVMEQRPNVPRAGVFAVRAGPVLSDNLHNFLQAKPLRTFEPQSRYLSIVNTADGHAIATRGGWSVQGRLAWRLKDAIDRRFMARYTTSLT